MIDYEIKKNVMDILNSFGVINANNAHDICILDYLNDSVQLMDFLCEIEERFSIEFDDEIIGYDMFNSLNGFCELIQSILECKGGDK